jgi:hypothetical protein
LTASRRRPALGRASLSPASSVLPARARRRVCSAPRAATPAVVCRAATVARAMFVLPVRRHRHRYRRCALLEPLANQARRRAPTAARCTRVHLAPRQQHRPLPCVRRASGPALGRSCACHARLVASALAVPPMRRAVDPATPATPAASARRGPMRAPMDAQPGDGLPLAQPSACCAA